jgi:hypothetical protein
MKVMALAFAAIVAIAALAGIILDSAHQSSENRYAAPSTRVN